MSPSSAELPADLVAAMELVYGPHGLTCPAPQMEAESADYGAYALEVGGRLVRFRVAKITPTKLGQFVTVWKRIGNGSIQPFDADDDLDLIVIACRDGELAGQFVFPKSVLVARDIVARDGVGGKRGIRVYPPWVVTESRQAAATQKWQVGYFLEMSGVVDGARARALYGA